ncbi:MAG TPA: oxidoreductase [bacterium]|nr:oxidoreductase [bacterium]
MKRKTIFITIGIAILVLVSILLYLINSNTHFINFNIDSEQIASNNENFSDADLSTFSEQTLIVPERFKEGTFSEERKLNLPEGFEISVYASGLNAARHFDFDLNNNMYVTDRKGGRLLFLPDDDGDRVADKVEVTDDDLTNPHGIDIFDGDLYLAEEHQVVVYRSINQDGTYFKKEVLISDLPSGSGHSTRTIRIGPNEKIYLTVGSSCNVCEEKDNRRAAMLEFDLDGSNQRIYAEGLRNTVDFTFANRKVDGTFEIWSVDNGRDLIGDDIPSEEVNVIEAGEHYGWPFCYGKGIVNPEYEGKQNDFCKNESVYPLYEMQAHSAPLGLSFIPLGGDMQEFSFPTVLQDNLFIAFHGSWNRTVPTGYKVVRIDTSVDDPQVVDFVTGWLGENGQSWGRPVGISFDANGDMFISDDKAGAVYKVSYNNNQ